MSRLRQLIRSSRENGGSASRSWGAKRTAWRNSLRTCQVPPACWKKRRSRSGLTSLTTFSAYRPSRANASASWSMSVPNTWMLGGSSRTEARSHSNIASEYASSPVAQPGTQTRIWSCPSASRNSSGTMSVSKSFHVSGSRKKRVTEIRKSRNSAWASSGVRRR